MNVPELTKGEYIRLEIAKACIAARPRDGSTAIGNDVALLAEFVINPPDKSAIVKGGAKQP